MANVQVSAPTLSRPVRFGTSFRPAEVSDLLATWSNANNAKVVWCSKATSSLFSGTDWIKGQVAEALNAARGGEVFCCRRH